MSPVSNILLNILTLSDNKAHFFHLTLLLYAWISLTNRMTVHPGLVTQQLYQLSGIAHNLPWLRGFLVFFSIFGLVLFVLKSLLGIAKQWSLNPWSHVRILLWNLTFVAFCLLSVVHMQEVKQYNYYVDQSELLTRFRTSSAWNFCRWV